MKVYAIHEGCRFEGGGVKEIYAKKENAIKFALMLVDIANKRAIAIHEEEGEEWQFKEQETHDKIIKCWQNPINEIYIYEYELK